MTKRYRINIKRDWGRYGFWNPETRTCEKQGFVVTHGNTNCIPGAGWFKTIEDAFIGIKAHMIAGDTMAFHDEYRRLLKEQNK